jgi:fructose-bisphosphate aldolase class II
MPLISDPIQVKEIYDQAAEAGICLANFCTANPRTTEAILRAASIFARQHGLAGVPMVLSVTANYPIEPQLQHYTASGNVKVGLRALLGDVESFLSEDSPYRDVQVLLHLDHARPGVDDEIIPLVLDKFSTIMYDCSLMPIAENIRRVAAFVEQHAGRVWVEGAVDEVVQAQDPAESHGHLTEPALAERYLRETGVFLIVPNLGTEHRAVAATAHYNSSLAQAIRDRVGPRMVLHGSSSLRDEDLPRLASDGIAKVNVWSILERLGGQAVAADVLHNLGNLLPTGQIRVWQAEGYLGPRFTDPVYQQEQCEGALGPKGWALVEHHRRDIWMGAVVARMLFYLEQFGYARW